MKQNIDGQLIVNMTAKHTQWGKNSLFNSKCWENWISTCKIIKMYLKPYTKINLKLIKNLKSKTETVKLLEENTGEKLLDIGLGNNFLDIDTKSTSDKSKNRQVRLHQAGNQISHSVSL